MIYGTLSIVAACIANILYGISLAFFIFGIIKSIKKYLSHYYSLCIVLFALFNIASFILSFGIQDSFLNGVLLFIFGILTMIV